MRGPGLLANRWIYRACSVLAMQHHVARDGTLANELHPFRLACFGCCILWSCVSFSIYNDATTWG